MAHKSQQSKLMVYPLIGQPGSGYETVGKQLDTSVVEYEKGDSYGSRSDSLYAEEWIYDPNYVFNKMIQKSEELTKPLVISFGGTNAYAISHMLWPAVFFLDCSDSTELIRRANKFRNSVKLNPLSKLEEESLAESAEKLRLAMDTAEAWGAKLIRLDALDDPKHIAEKICDHFKEPEVNAPNVTVLHKLRDDGPKIAIITGISAAGKNYFSDSHFESKGKAVLDVDNYETVLSPNELREAMGSKRYVIIPDGRLSEWVPILLEAGYDIAKVYLIKPGIALFKKATQLKLDKAEARRAIVDPQVIKWWKQTLDWDEQRLNLYYEKMRDKIAQSLPNATIAEEINDPNDIENIKYGWHKNEH